MRHVPDWNTLATQRPSEGDETIAVRVNCECGRCHMAFCVPTHAEAIDEEWTPWEPAVPELKAKIDALSQLELCRKWRFAVGDPMLQGQAGEYFKQRLEEKGGFTPAISKELGWD